MDEFRRRPVNRVSTPTDQSGMSPQMPSPVVPSQTRPVETPAAPLQSSVTPPIIHQPIEDASAPPVKPPRKSWKKKIMWIAASLVAAILVIGIGGWIWYSSQLAAVDANDTSRKLIAIESGSTPTQIAQTLK
ncbi:MAG: hypothetical protein ACREGE_02705, partial [Candidatus Microsaccharimonas sp.]